MYIVGEKHLMSQNHSSSDVKHRLGCPWRLFDSEPWWPVGSSIQVDAMHPTPSRAARAPRELKVNHLPLNEANRQPSFQFRWFRGGERSQTRARLQHGWHYEDEFSVASGCGLTWLYKHTHRALPRAQNQPAARADFRGRPLRGRPRKSASRLS